MKAYPNIAKFDNKWLFEKSCISPYRVKYSIITITPRIILIIEIVMVCFFYAVISICELANYWIQRTRYSIIKKRLNMKK